MQFYCVYAYFRATISDTQGLLLILLSGTFLKSLGIMCNVRDCTFINHIQSKHVVIPILNHYLSSSSQNVTTRFAAIWVELKEIMSNK